MSRLRRAVLASLLAGAGAAAYATWVRPRLHTWGATPDEAARRYPGDELVPDADGVSTMATTLPAPPEKVWPWLAQMGGDRGGWYSWDLLDRGGRPSADRLVPQWQELQVGQRLEAAAHQRSWFEVAQADPPTTLVLRSDLGLPSGRSFDPRTGPLPRAYLDGIWSFHLTPTADGGTRLVVRTRGRGRPRPLTRTFDTVLGEPAHFVMQVRQFQNLRHRVATPL